MTITSVKLTNSANLQATIDTSSLSLSPSRISSNPERREPLTKSVYRAEQQAKFLNLQAEVDSLLCQLQVMKEQRQKAIATSCNSSEEQLH